MTAKRLTYLLLTPLLFSCNDGSMRYQQVNGTWRGDCENGSGHIILQPNTTDAFIEVNSNQIVIKASVDTNLLRSQRQLTLKLVGTEDLGRGGMMLDWKHFSHSKPIATITLSNDKEATLQWLGFYNDSTNNYEWAAEADLLAYPTLYRCGE